MNIEALPLQYGDKIAVVSPSSAVIPASLESGINYLKGKGFQVHLGKHVYDKERFLAGKDEDRARDIHDFFKDPEIKAIIVSRGGQGSQRILPLLDYDLIQKNPKIFIGFSDTTALQLGLLNRVGLVSYTGYTLTIQPNEKIDETLMCCLMGKPYKIIDGTPLVAGKVSGPLIGGNLTLLTALLGTPYQPDFKNSILLIEDVAIEPYKVDGMFSHLSLAGVFEQVAGVIIGQFERCLPHEDNKDEDMGTVEDVIDEWSSRMRVPCLKDFPYGHGQRSSVLPIGGMVTLNVSEKSVEIL